MDQVNDSHLSFLGLKDSKGQLCLKVLACVSYFKLIQDLPAMTVFSVKRKSEACFADAHEANQKRIILLSTQSLSTDALIQVNFCRNDCVKAL